MDELEILKKDWKKEGKNFPKLSYDDIYKMILKNPPLLLNGFSL